MRRECIRIKTKTHRKKAFTLFELVVVIVVLAILIAGLTFYGSGSVERTRRTTVENFLRVIANDMETAYDDYGPCKPQEGLAPAELKQTIDDFCAFLEDEYLHTALDPVEPGDVAANGFTVFTRETDPWGTPYRIYYVTAENKEGDFFVASAGPDLEFSDGSYFNGRFGDDIVVVAAMKR